MHAIGEVWAQILWVVSQRLIEKHGFVDDLFPPKPLEDGTIPEGDFYRPREYFVDGKPKPLVPKHGNSLIVQLVLDGMKLQPCRPTFFNARDAIIAADKTLTGGENFCELWEAFASRGLGVDSKVKNTTPWGGGVRTNVSRNRLFLSGDGANEIRVIRDTVCLRSAQATYPLRTPLRAMGMMMTMTTTTTGRGSHGSSRSRQLSRGPGPRGERRCRAPFAARPHRPLAHERYSLLVWSRREAVRACWWCPIGGCVRLRCCLFWCDHGTLV